MAQRRTINVDSEQYDEIQQYCNITGATKSWVARDAIALWLRTVKPRMLKSVSRHQPKRKETACNEPTTSASAKPRS
jgi:hypothetical protein